MDGLILPFDIIENILSRLPVKSLLRFKLVSKSWKTTISDPRFARTHLKQSKNSYSQYQLMWYPNKFQDSHVNVVKFENQKFHIVSAVKYPWETYFHVLCHCDGLLLTRFANCTDMTYTYVLWNPSSRSYTKFHCPHSIHVYHKTTYGLCYDPLIMDYKVIITDMKHYVIYYCRNNYWTEMKEVLSSCGEVLETGGFSFDGDFYWSVISTRPDDESAGLLFEMICFDSKAEKFKKVPMHESIGPFDSKALVGNLCLIPYTPFGPSNQLSLMKKSLISGFIDKFSVPLQFLGSNVYPMCLINKDEIILGVIDESFGVYKLSTRTFAKVPIPSTGEKFPGSVCRLPRFVPYQDNIYVFQQSNEQAKRKLG